MKLTKGEISNSVTFDMIIALTPTYSKSNFFQPALWKFSVKCSAIVFGKVLFVALQALNWLALSF